MQTQRSRQASIAPLGIVLATGALLTGCGLAEDIADSLDTSNSKLHQVDTGAEGKESGLLADWVPDDAQDVHVLQRTTGSERLLTFEYSGGMPSECLEIDTVGSPTQEELAAAYETDARTRDFEVNQWSTEPTMQAEWWSAGHESRTTHLCGRWWVSEAEGVFHAFAAELNG